MKSLAKSRIAILAACIVCAAIPAVAASCESLATLALPNATIAVAQPVSGSFTPPEPNAKPIPNLPAFCRVSGVIKPSSDSDIKFEVWMPASGWNGKYQGMGNGGFAGSISWAPMVAAVAGGYAASSTDTGHEGSAIVASWGLDHPEKITDFGYRAIHETAEKSKLIIKAFYGNNPKHSYFSSCSNGGRQAMMEAQRYPADYDGIIAGAPALSFTHTAVAFVSNLQAMDDPASYIPAKKMAAVEAAVLAACDAQDGVKDGVIDDPTQCHFDPAKILCSGAESDSCLTQPQVTALKKIYAGPANSKGEKIIAGFEPGGESGMAGWPLWITGSGPGKSLEFSFGTQFFGNMVFDKANWDYHTFQIDRDTKAADDRQAKNLNATDTDLKRFKDRGGKLILYHGWSDAALPPVNTIEYYKSVGAKMGAKNAEAFVRLFMVPGMQHCAGGPGPSSFGQLGAAEGDAQHDIARALEHWVEDGVAPSQIIATKFKSPMNPASGVVRTRPLCAYPQVARWNGSGSTDDAANFTCGTREGTQ